MEQPRQGFLCLYEDEHDFYQTDRQIQVFAGTHCALYTSVCKHFFIKGILFILKDESSGRSCNVLLYYFIIFAAANVNFTFTLTSSPVFVILSLVVVGTDIPDPSTIFIWAISYRILLPSVPFEILNVASQTFLFSLVALHAIKGNVNSIFTKRHNGLV